MRRLPLVFWSASRPPGPRLLLRDFLSVAIGFARCSFGCIALISAVAFSLSTAAVIFERGTWAIERRERGPRDPEELLLGAMREEEGKVSKKHLICKPGIVLEHGE